MDKTTSKAGDQSKIKALDELFSRSASYKKSSEFLELLKFIKKFPSLSPYNAFLIHMQNKGVQIAMPAGKWENYGRTPKINARPLIILVPFGPVDFVYDILDTEGKDVPPALLNPFLTKGQISSDIQNRLLFSLQKDGLKYEEYSMHKANAGYAQTKRSILKIAINSSLNPEEKFSTLIHELAHIYCGHLGINDSSWWMDRMGLSTDIMEIEAESISYLVCNRFNLTASSEAYLATYVKDNENLPALSLETILVVSGYIESMMKPGFKSKMKKAKQ